jgi:hypothetical protein
MDGASLPAKEAEPPADAFPLSRRSSPEPLMRVTPLTATYPAKEADITRECDFRAKPEKPPSNQADKDFSPFDVVSFSR